jgi:hypothetical protein
MKAIKTRIMNVLFGIFLAGALLCALIARGHAQVTVPGQPIVPLGYCQIATLTTSTALTACSGGIPTGATMALIQAEAFAIQYRDDSIAPTATVGMPVAAGGSFFYVGTLSKLRVIEKAAGAKLNVLFYR